LIFFKVIFYFDFSEGKIKKEKERKKEKKKKILF